jgi:hypothetical protein
VGCFRVHLVRRSRRLHHHQGTYIQYVFIKFAFGFSVKSGSPGRVFVAGAKKSRSSHSLRSDRVVVKTIQAGVPGLSKPFIHLPTAAQ